MVGQMPSFQISRPIGARCPTSHSRFRSGIDATYTWDLGESRRSVRSASSNCSRKARTGVIARVDPRQASLAPISTVTSPGRLAPARRICAGRSDIRAPVSARFQLRAPAAR
jgi:hypothetical protein